jgi:hypothetical protein
MVVFGILESKFSVKYSPVIKCTLYNNMNLNIGSNDLHRLV